MNDKFGQFDWKCYKDKKPSLDVYIYIYNPYRHEEGVNIGLVSEYVFDKDDN